MGVGEPTAVRGCGVRLDGDEVPAAVRPVLGCGVWGAQRPAQALPLRAPCGRPGPRRARAQACRATSALLCGPEGQSGRRPPRHLHSILCRPSPQRPRPRWAGAAAPPPPRPRPGARLPGSRWPRAPQGLSEQGGADRETEAEGGRNSPGRRAKPGVLPRGRRCAQPPQSRPEPRPVSPGSGAISRPQARLPCVPQGARPCPGLAARPAPGVSPCSSRPQLGPPTGRSRPEPP